MGRQNLKDGVSVPRMIGHTSLEPVVSTAFLRDDLVNCPNLGRDELVGLVVLLRETVMRETGYLGIASATVSVGNIALRKIVH
jgi:hypothetical protein